MDEYPVAVQRPPCVFLKTRSFRLLFSAWGFSSPYTAAGLGNASPRLHRLLLFCLGSGQLPPRCPAHAGTTLSPGRFATQRCMTCHMLNLSNPIGSDNRFHNVGVSARKQNFADLTRRALDALQKEDNTEVSDHMALETEFSELGRLLVTKNQADIGAFKTLQLRNVGITPPYMHDGSMQTLWDVMDHYNKGGEANPFLDGGIEPLALTEEEIDDLVEFMPSLFNDLQRLDRRAFLKVSLAAVGAALSQGVELSHFPSYLYVSPTPKRWSRFALPIFPTPIFISVQ